MGDHWYHRDASPCYEVEGKPTTLRHARKMNLVPSPTSVLGVIHKPGLQTWKDNQLFEAARSLPDASLGEVKGKAGEIAAEAAEKGTGIHDSIERLIAYSEGRVEDYHIPDDVMDPHAQAAFLEWYATNGCHSIWIERYIPTTYGYGGRCDWVGTMASEGEQIVTVDWKSQSTKNGKINWYKEWPIQLAAYAQALELLDHPIASVVISTTEPGLVEHKIWGSPRNFIHVWHCVFDLWKWQKGYDPLDLPF